MPNYEFKDINKDVVEKENYAPNKVKTTEQTNKKIRSKAEIVTKVVENVVSSIEENSNVKEKIKAGVSSLLCDILSVPDESDVIETKDPNVILLTKVMKENVGKAMETLGDLFDKPSSLKKSVEENKVESEDKEIDENKEDVNENSDLSNEISEEPVNEDVVETQEQEIPEMPIVENEENVENKEADEMPSFEQSFDWQKEERTASDEEPTIINDDVTFNFPDIADVDNTNDVSLPTDDVYTSTEEEKDLSDMEIQVPENEDNISINNEQIPAYNYSGVGSSQLYNECSRLSYIVNSYGKQAEQFDEELNNEQAEIEKLRQEIAVHEENIRNIEANKNKAYEVFIQAQKEIEPIAALFGMNNASYENDNNKHRGM